MRGMSEFIKDHERQLAQTPLSGDFISYHLTQVHFLQHERLVHLLVMLFVMAVFLLFFVLFLVLQSLWLFGLFLLCLILTVFYVIHYFKLENTVTRWYFLYNDALKNNNYAPSGGVPQVSPLI